MLGARFMVRGVPGCPGTVVVARRFVVRSWFVRRRVGVGFSAAGPRVPRGRAPPGHEVPTERKGSPLIIIISFSLGFLRVCVCVCVRPRPVK